MKKIAIVAIHDIHLALFIPLTRLLKDYEIETTFLLPTFIDENILSLNSQKYCTQKDLEILSNKKIPSNIEHEISIAADNESLLFDEGKRKKVSKKIEKILIKQATLVNNFLIKEKVDLVITWNGTFNISAITRQLCFCNKIRLIACENGAIPGLLQVDPQGVNAESAFNKDDFSLHINQKTKISYQKDIKSNLLKIAYPSAIFDLPARIKSIITSYHLHNRFLTLLKTLYIAPFYKNKLLKRDLINLPKKFMFFPLQVFDDTQILFNSPYFKSMEESIDFIYPIIRDSFPDYKLVIKEHPADLVRKNYAKFKTKYPGIIWLKKYPLEPLLDKTSLVITINSGVGVESLLHYKPVVVLGDAVYAQNGITYPINSKEDVKNKIESGLRDGADKKAIDAFIKELKEKTLIDCDWRNVDKKGVINFANYILNRLDDKR